MHQPFPQHEQRGETYDMRRPEWASVEISVADQMWLDDAYFKEKQLRLGTDAPRAALAYRVSTKGQVDHDDIPMQKIDCRKFAQKQGWRVVKEVAEKGVSGSKVSASKRDAIQQLKEEAANGEFDILLVYMFDRLGRIESETPFVLEWFVQHGIEMWSTHEGQQKIETHGDKLMNYIRFWQAAGESEKTSIRTRDRIRQQELDDAKAEYAELQNARLNEAAEIRKLRTYYDDFKGWAEEFDTAPLEMKRMILSHLIDRVEVGRKYQVIVKFNMKYRQFLECTAETYNTEIGA